ncbi:GntR family transcriptional regulator [Fodinicola feengrottensis]|uniref:GntR family transcriptional regulator n=1 Tax=Fodinicola feengrottensis TaxID=435914 RepID=A0ABN2HCF2_9ACTN|nr:GntR family transcriptional regulator [Fodinicola feengrottensis]
MEPKPYERIVADIRRQIVAGELRAGDRVPATRQIAKDWGVAIVTASKALATLRQEGLVQAVPRVGTVVSQPKRRVRAAESTHEIQRDNLVRVAIEIADAEGRRALSMRRVATELGVPTMSIYRHVRNREELELLMADAAFAQASLPATPPVGWRAQLELLMRTQWAMCRRHPWLAHVISVTRPRPAPHLATHVEWVMRAIDGHGLDPNTMITTHIMLFSCVRAIAINLEPEAEAEQDTGMTSLQWMDVQEDNAMGVILRPQYPVFARVTEEADFDLNLDELFEFTMARTLDGLAPLLTPG